MSRSQRALRWPALVLAAVLCTGPVAADEAIEQGVLDAIQSARRAAGRGELERRKKLDAAARGRARIVALAPQAQRLSLRQPIDIELRSLGVTRYRRAVPYLVLKSGYDDYAQAFIEGWTRQPSRWAEALSESIDAIGIAIERASDGWVILAVVLLEDLDVVSPTERSLLERQALDGVNEARRDNGLPALVEDETLTKIARAHSEDMALRGYFAHESPEGLDTKARVRRQHIVFARLGENLHKSRGIPDAARHAVESWLASRSHRRPILNAEYTRTGLGVAIDDDGTYYFTQLFLLPGD